MLQFTITRLTASITHICDPSGVACFLAVGNKRAALIDTGSGFVGLKDEVGRLTSLPLDVIITHGHCDHAGGAAMFDSVYLHPADEELALRHNSIEMRMGYASLNPDLAISERDFAPAPVGPFKPLGDGQIFDLGGVTLEAVHFPGHTRGMSGILFREERAMLYGDACNSNTFLFGPEASTVSQYQETLRKIKLLDGKYDTAYYSHGPAVGPRQTLDDNIELCGRILRGEDDKLPFEFMGSHALRAAAIGENYQRLDGKCGNIIYSAEKLQGGAK